MRGQKVREPHPMAGASGEGPPVAPPKWRWRCGNRLRDMYFYSPDLTTFRSRKALAEYLATLRGGPSPDDFCWTVTKESLANGASNKEVQVWNRGQVPPKTSRALRNEAKKAVTAKEAVTPKKAIAPRKAKTPEKAITLKKAVTPERARIARKASTPKKATAPKKVTTPKKATTTKKLTSLKTSKTEPGKSAAPKSPQKRKPSDKVTIKSPQPALHPLAGAFGDGPPVAPPNWKWRCGNRQTDMYFYSPELKVYRSKKELAAYLGTLSDAPSIDDFCWKVTQESITNGVWDRDAKVWIDRVVSQPLIPPNLISNILASIPPNTPPNEPSTPPYEAGTTDIIENSPKRTKLNDEDTQGTNGSQEV